eukprot:4075-Heterococcus_DN1.PRE.2
MLANAAASMSNTVLYSMRARDVQFSMSALDCIATTACTGNELPDSMTDAMVDGAMELSTYIETYKLLYDDSHISKAECLMYTRNHDDSQLVLRNTL